MESATRARKHYEHGTCTRAGKHMEPATRAGKRKEPAARARKHVPCSKGEKTWNFVTRARKLM